MACAGILLLGAVLGLAPSRPAAVHTTAAVAPSAASPAPAQHWFRGYAATGPRTAPGTPGVTAAAGTIVVPAVTGGPSELWVGVSSGPTLVQAGVQVDGNPAADYAWLANCAPGACHPHPAPASFVVRPGDHIRISIAWVGTHWTITVRDLTEHWSGVLLLGRRPPPAGRPSTHIRPVLT